MRSEIRTLIMAAAVIAMMSVVFLGANSIFGDETIRGGGGAGEDHTHKLIHCATSDNPLCAGQPKDAVVQDGSPLWTNEGVSGLDRNVLTCRDTNKNAAWIHCRMIDKQSGDRVSCTDQVQGDAYPCWGFGKGTRTYEIHQNGYIQRGSDRVHWNPKRSVH